MSDLLPIDGKDANELLLKLLETSDYKIQANFQREAFIRHHPQIALILLNRGNTNVDSLYNEASDPDWDHPIMVHAHIDHSPSKYRLQKYGMDEERTLLVTFSTVLLLDQKILQPSTTFLVGSIVRFDSDLYEIKTQTRSKDGYWGSSNFPFHIVCACDRYRHGR